jgi:hypothetical protein
MMQKLLFGLAALPFLATIAWAGQPLSDQQMDRLVAGSVAFIEPGFQPALPPPQSGYTYAFGSSYTYAFGLRTLPGSPTLPQNLFTPVFSCRVINRYFNFAITCATGGNIQQQIVWLI